MKKRLLSCGLALLAWGAAASTTQVAASLVDLSLEELANVRVTSVSRRAEPVATAAASVFVITGEDIRRSGAITIMEALRLAPNLQVARSGSTGYAITARGFNQGLANKLLVLVDGRTVYSPFFAGVFWDAQDVLLEDVERIEVISGPGGTLWGANAVNGVINILTKSAAQTQGTMLSAGGGDEGNKALARQGGRLGAGHYRVYGQLRELPNMWLEGGAPIPDGSKRVQSGFRTDWAGGRDGLTVQGDLYRDEGDQQQILDGANLLARWRRELDAGSAFTLQTYFDQTTRTQQVLNTWDVEGTYSQRRGRHQLVLGASYRHQRDRIETQPNLAVIPAEKNLDTASLFVFDEIALADSISAGLGLKLEHNDYTGAEYLPSVKLGWRPNARDFVWTQWSRAVRSPSRLDRETFIPGSPPFFLTATPQFESEIADVYELGYRGQPAPQFSWSVTGFYHDYDKLRSVRPEGTTSVIANDRIGRVSGFEGWGTWRVTDGWRLAAGYTQLDTRIEVRPGGIDTVPLSSIASDPEEWWNLRSSHDLGRDFELDLMVREVGGIANRSVPRYTATDVRVGWRIARGAQLALAVRNLFDPRHIEWGPGAAELRRAAYASARFDLP
jgi:iron complex outermembrane receptor protein